MPLSKTMSELISRLNSYTLEELIEDLVLDSNRPNGVCAIEYVFQPSDDILWSTQKVVWGYDNVFSICERKGFLL